MLAKFYRFFIVLFAKIRNIIKREAILTGANTEVYSGGCEILKRKNFTKKRKKGYYLKKTIVLK